MPVSGSFVNTMGSVINLPPSSGHVFRIGKISRDGLSLTITSLQGPDLTDLGMKSESFLSFGRAFSFSMILVGISGSRNSSMRSPISSRLSTSRASRILSKEPKVFTRTGNFEFFGFSNKSAGPLAFTTLSFISAISRTGSTSIFIRLKSPFFSRTFMNSLRSLYAIEL